MKALPDAVDLIVTTVEAGLAIDAALSEVGHETRGPLGEELRLTVARPPSAAAVVTPCSASSSAPRSPT
jgi:Flp pilus assembly protein TadB